MEDEDEDEEGEWSGIRVGTHKNAKPALCWRRSDAHPNAKYQFPTP